MKSNALRRGVAIATLLSATTPLRADEIFLQPGAEITVNGVGIGLIYSGASDAEIREAAPDTNFDGGTGGPGGTGGGDAQLLLGADTPDGSGLRSQALLRFDSSIGVGPGQIPPGSLVTRAILRLDIDDSGDRHRLLALQFPWDESSVTWNNAGTPGNGVDLAADSIERLTYQDQFGATPLDLRDFYDVTADIVAALADPASHHGWALSPLGPDEVAFHSIHYTDGEPDGGVGRRPSLTIRFDPPLADVNASQTPAGDVQIDILAPEPNPATFDLHVTNDHFSWTRAALVDAPLGIGQFIAPFGPEPRRFYRASPLPALGAVGALGEQPLVIQDGFVPGTVVHFDIDGDTIADQSATVGADGLLVAALDLTGMGAGTHPVSYVTSNGGVTSAPAAFDVEIDPTPNPASVLAFTSVPEAAICECEEFCPPAASVFSGSFTPNVHDVELFTGKVRKNFPITSFPARLIDFRLSLHYASMTQYNGPFGHGFSHSYNMMIARTGPDTGVIVTPDLRIYQISSPDGIDWQLPDGFFSRLTLDPATHRWTLTHFTGRRIEFYEALPGQPGRPLAMSEPNGNTMRFGYNASGLLTTVATPLGQVQRFHYRPDGRLAAFQNHLGHSWLFGTTPGGQLQQIEMPPTEFVWVPPGQLLNDANLAAQTFFARRNIYLVYSNTALPSHITQVFDGRGALVQEIQYDLSGPVVGQVLNGKPEIYDYGAPAVGPTALPVLDPGNRVTRVIDRDQNITDYEIHGIAGGPVGGTGMGGLRRRVTWTETGKGQPALRPGEPDYYEQRFLFDCDCLKPFIGALEHASTDPVSFGPDGIPVNWPRHQTVFNANRQPLQTVYTDGAEEIRKEFTYQPQSFGDGGQYSRRTSYLEPRQFDTHPVNAGLSFTHTYTYDSRGNRLTHVAPAVTRGVAAPQAVTRSWTYNAFGQPLTLTGPAGNVTRHTYHSGPGSGGDANTQGTFGGYRASVTYGAPGSVDSGGNLNWQFRVNALGRETLTVDPAGNPHTWRYNDAGERVQHSQPPVTLAGGGSAQYHNLYFYDPAGNEVLRRRTNLDEAGALSAANPFLDRATAYDAVGNVVARSVEISETTRLVTRYAYDANDQLAVEQLPRGNRVFTTYDERGLRLRRFYGVEAGATPADGYPASDADPVLAGHSFVGVERFDYDSRSNCVAVTDGRGALWRWHYDFNNRRVAHRDPNGNGYVCEYDDASQQLTRTAGEIDAIGNLVTAAERLYSRYDEAGRMYQRAFDIDLASSESLDPDPDDGANPSYLRAHDAGHRPVTETDAEGNTTQYQYDSANRVVESRDALGNRVTYAYDQNSNLVERASIQLPGPGLTGIGHPVSETYVQTYDYDELNRLVVRHDRGLGGTALDHQTVYSYDSRHNRRRVEDAEGRLVILSYDDADRLVSSEKFDDATLAKRLELAEFAYDANGNQTLIRTFPDQGNPATGQETRLAYDDLDRLARKVFPDSDDPLAGPGLGADGLYDRRDIAYDANSNRVTVTDQRGVVATYAYDSANRLVSRVDALAGGALGNTRTEWDYDSLNRVTRARNDFADIARAYDPISRQLSETQSIRLDGAGFTDGYQFPVTVHSEYDRHSNRVRCLVTEGANTDLEIECDFDALNRPDVTRAAYFGTALHLVADRDHYGPERLGACTYGSGARTTYQWDAKQRLAEIASTGGSTLLTSYQYAYDRVDNPLFERLGHDADRYDHFGYNPRDELTGAEYRSASATPSAGPFPTTIQYDDHDNRVSATLGDAFNNSPPVIDNYTVNAANEYSTLFRSTAAFLPVPAHDLAGNATTYPVLPAHLPFDAPAAMQYQADNTLFTIDILGATQQYRYDPFRRRVAVLEGAAGSETPVRRFIYDGWNVLEERAFDPGATPAHAPSTLERVYVHNIAAPSRDDRFLCAIDTDGDRRLGPAGGGANPLKNQPDPASDQEYYYLHNRLGSVAALSNADDPAHVLEYCRYTATGEPSVVPGLGPADTADQTLDNNLAAGLARESRHGNPYLFTGRRWDGQTGLYYHRNRYYEPRSARFLQRDPAEEDGGLNLYNYVRNRTTRDIDPLGLDRAKPNVTVDGWELTSDGQVPVRVRAYGSNQEYFDAWNDWFDNDRDFRTEPTPWKYEWVDADDDYLQRIGSLLEDGVRRALDEAGRRSGRWTVVSSPSEFGSQLEAVRQYGGNPTNTAPPEADYTIKMKVEISNYRDPGWVKTGWCTWVKNGPIADYKITIWSVDKDGKTRKKRTFEFTHSAGDPHGAGQKAGNMFLHP